MMRRLLVTQWTAAQGAGAIIYHPRAKAPALRTREPVRCWYAASIRALCR